MISEILSKIHKGIFLVSLSGTFVLTMTYISDGKDKHVIPIIVCACVLVLSLIIYGIRIYIQPILKFYRHILLTSYRYIKKKEICKGSMHAQNI